MGNPTPTTQIATIPDLPAAVPLTGAELLWINQAGLDRSVTTSAVGALGGAGLYLPLTGGSLTGDLNVGGNQTVSGSLTVGGLAYGTTPVAGDNSAAFATTAFVDAALAGITGVSSWNTRTGAVTLTLADVTGVGGAAASQLANYLPLAGGAVTGALSVGGALTATTVAPGDSTTNVATTAFVANALLTAGAGRFLPLTGGSLTGALTGTAATFNGGLVLNGNPAVSLELDIPQPTIVMNKQGGGSYANYIMGRTAGNNRWIIALGDGATETGSNNGSLFQVYACNDAGANNTSVITCTRAGGGYTTTFGGPVYMPSGSGIHYAPGANGVAFLWAPGSYLTVSIDGGPAGPILSPFPGTGWQTINAGYVNTANTQGSINTPNGSMVWSGSPSDRRLKSNLKPSGDALDYVKRLAVYDLEFNPASEHWPFSLIADEVAEVMPYAAMSREENDGEHWVGLHPTHLCAVLWKAVQELAAEVEALKPKGA